MRLRFSQLVQILRGRSWDTPNGSEASPSQDVLVFSPVPTHRFPTIGQWGYVWRVLTRLQRILLLTSVVLFVGTASAATLRWIGRATEVVPAMGGRYTEGLVGSVGHVNPLLAPLSDVDADITKLVFSGLFRTNGQQMLEPDLITNYVVSEDQLTYSFFLNPNVHWHDGTPLTADDVLFTINAMQDSQYKSPLAATMKGVQATKLDNTSFSLKLSEPYAPFLTTLTFGILPSHLWYDIPAPNAALTELNIQPVGTGPYKFQSLVKDKAGNIKSMLLVRNDDFYGRKPNIAELQFTFFPDVETAVEALKTKHIEGLSFVPQDRKDELQKQQNSLGFYALRLPQYVGVFFQQSKNDVLKEKVVRQALARGVNRDAIIADVLQGAAEPIFSPILPGFLGFNPDAEKYLYDVTAANAALDEAGWKFPESAPTDGAFVPREKDGVKLQFRVTTVDRPEYHQTLEKLVEQWAAIGVLVDTEYASPNDFQSRVIKNRDYQALLFGEIVGSDPDPFPFWHSSQQEHPGFGLAIFRNRDIDELLEQARKTTNSDERVQKYLDFQNKIADAMPAILLYNPLYIYAVQSKVHDVQSQYILSPSDRFANIASWYIFTDRQWK